MPTLNGKHLLDGRLLGSLTYFERHSIIKARHREVIASASAIAFVW